MTATSRGTSTNQTKTPIKRERERERKKAISRARATTPVKAREHMPVLNDCLLLLVLRGGIILLVRMNLKQLLREKKRRKKDVQYENLIVMEVSKQLVGKDRGILYVLPALRVFVIPYENTRLCDN